MVGNSFQIIGAATEKARLPRFSFVLGIESCWEVDDRSCLGMLEKYRRLARYSTGALDLGWRKKCRKLIFSGYISGLPLIENLMSPQKSPLGVLHNFHIN